MAEQQAWAKAHYQLLTETGERVGVTVSGRDKWALSELIEAGERGCTAIDNPAPRGPHMCMAYGAEAHLLRPS